MYVVSDHEYQEHQMSDADLMAMKAVDERQMLRAAQREEEDWLPEGAVWTPWSRSGSTASVAPHSVVPLVRARGPPRESPSVCEC